MKILGKSSMYRTLMTGFIYGRLTRLNTNRIVKFAREFTKREDETSLMSWKDNLMETCRECTGKKKTFKWFLHLSSVTCRPAHPSSVAENKQCSSHCLTGLSGSNSNTGTLTLETHTRGDHSRSLMTSPPRNRYLKLKDFVRGALLQISQR